MKFFLRRSFSILSFSLVCLVGCSGGDSGDPELRRSAYELHDSGLAAFENGDYEKAAAELGEATKGGLNSDSYSDAAVHLAVALAHLGKTQESLDLITKLEEGAPNLDEVLAAKSYVYAKQGNKSEAKKYLQQARRINPRVKPFRD